MATKTKLTCLKHRGSTSIMMFMMTSTTWCQLRKLHGSTVHKTGNRKAIVATLTEANQYQRLADSVTPLHRKSYDEQLKVKGNHLRRALRTVVNIIKHNMPPSQLTESLKLSSEANSGQMCPFRGIKPSPELFFYRNKDEVSVGTDVHGNKGKAGFCIGRGYDQGVYVGPKYVLSMKKKHKEIVEVYQEFLRQSSKGDKIHGCDGYWSNLVMRTNQEGETMITAVCRKNNETKDLEGAKEELIDFFRYGTGSKLNLSSVYFSSGSHSNWHNTSSELVLGRPHLYEHVLGRKFRISPKAFFQTNTPAAEVLYSTIRDFVKMSSATSLIDVCCGTGIIGVLTSDLVTRVHGLEMVEQAVEDAAYNAQLNGVKNAEFICGQAHKAVKNILQDKLTDDTMAVLNPSRVGVNSKVIKGLRMCDKIRHVLYVSCKPRGNVTTNFIDLLLPESEKMPGRPFQALEAVGVDLFPHTMHCELLVLFNR